MRVLIAHERFAPDFAGGGEVAALESAHQIERLGGEVRVVTTGDPAITEYEGIPTRRITPNRYGMNFQAAEIERAARDVDVIHTSTYHACLPALRAGRRLGLPVVCQIMGFFEGEWTRMKGPVVGRLFERWEQFLVTRPYDRIVFPSDYAIERGVACGVSRERIRLVSPGVDVQTYGPRWPKDDVVLFVGKVDPRKGIDEFLAVARRLPDVRFEVYGWGPRAAQYRESAPANVTFTPFERGAPLREALARARIALLPSWAETFGIVVIEAMASGCAIVSSIDLEYEGALVAPGDDEAMAEAVSKLWHDTQGCRAMGERNVELAGQHSWDRYGEGYYALYQEVIAERAGGGR